MFRVSGKEQEKKTSQIVGNNLQIYGDLMGAKIVTDIYLKEENYDEDIFIYAFIKNNYKYLLA